MSNRTCRHSHPRRHLLQELEPRRLLASPVIDTIADATVFTGKSLIIPLTSSDADGDTVSWQVTSSDPAILPVIHLNNPWIKMAVAGYGDLIFQLMHDVAPHTTDTIGGLAQAGYYDGLTFHRVIPNFMIQGGDPSGNGTGGPGFVFDDEFNSQAIFTGKYQLAMAKSADDTNGSQFFITTGQPTYLNYQHTIFGQLVRGGSIVDAISNVARDSNDKPNTPVVISSARYVEDSTDAVVTLVSSAALTSPATITVTATDSHGNQTVSTFHVSTATDSHNDNPYLVNPVSNLLTPINTPATIPMPYFDLESDPVNVSGEYVDQASANNTTAGSVNSDKSVTITPATGYTGPINIALGVSEYNISFVYNPSETNYSNYGPYWDTQVFTIVVGDQAATLNSANLFSQAGSSVALTSSFVDPDPHASVGPVEIADGSFEQPVVGSGGTSSFSAGSSLGVWTVLGNGVSLSDAANADANNGVNQFNVADGQQAVDLTGPNPGGAASQLTSGISQLVATVPGEQYMLRFQVGRASGAAGLYDTPSTVDVRIDNGNRVSFTNSTTNTTGSVSWKEFSYTFVATSSTTNIAFLNGTTDNHYVGLDNVRILPDWTSAVVNWGDGHLTASATITKNADGSFKIDASNTYAKSGVYPVIVTLTSSLGQVVTARAVANVYDISGMGGQAVHFAGTVAGADPNSVAIVRYGDGSADPITLDTNSAYAFDHTYSAGFYAASITPAGSNISLPMTHVLVDSAAPVAHVTGVSTTVAGHSITLGLSATDSVAQMAAGFTFTVDWKDGTVDTIPVGTTSASHTYAAAGLYNVSITAKDNADVTSSAVTHPITVSNVFAGPDGTANEGAVFSITGQYNPDFSGTGTITFGDNTAAQPLALNNGAFTATHTYDDNGQYNVTVTLTPTTGSPVTDVAVATINSVAPSATVGGATTGVRGAPATITLASTDISTADTAAGFSYVINWNDDTLAQTIALGGTSATHTYTAAGTYHVTVTPKDKDGATGSPVTHDITISVAGLIADPVTNGKMALVVGGTTGNDTITLSPVAGGNVTVLLGAIILGTFKPTGRIQVFGQAGNDKITISGKMASLVDLFGGDGNDTLNGSPGNDILVGGAGNDAIFGNAGRDILIGGAGADKLDGGAGDDILLSDSSAYESNFRALAGIQKEWIRTNATYAQRVAHVTGSSGGQNSSFFLKSPNISKDTSVDSLTGGADNDLYILNSTGAGTHDKTVGKLASETLKDLA